MDDYVFGNVRQNEDGTSTLVNGKLALFRKRYAASELKLLLIEPRGALNTDDEGGERSAASAVWI